MAYQIDFTAANYASRSCRKWFLRLLLLAAIGGAAWGVHYVYAIYKQPTLNMKLAEYEVVARPIEEINTAWDLAAKDFNALLRYYRLIWAANPTNFLEAMVSPDAPRLGRGFYPRSWALKTGGECQLDYCYTFNPGDKAAQAKGLESALIHAVTSIVQVVEGKVEVQGVQLENLLKVEELNLVVKFALPDVKAFPLKEKTLTDCVNEIGDLRKKVQESRFMKVADAKGDPTTALALMTMPYIEIGHDMEGLPSHANAIDIMGWLRNADRFVESAVEKTGKKIPDSDVKRRQHLKDVWNKIGEARLPWERFRVLDNDELVANTKDLETVSDGVKRFKVFLDQRRADCKKKLEPFVKSYDHDRVFNEPLIEADLKDRFAKEAGILRASTSFKDEPNVEAALLDTADSKFTFTWVRWTLLMGKKEEGRRKREERRGKKEEETDSATAVPKLPLTLERLADCVRRILKQPGPGYVLDTVKVKFDKNGNVSDAVLEGLLPVKKAESLKPETP